MAGQGQDRAGYDVYGRDRRPIHFLLFFPRTSCGNLRRPKAVWDAVFEIWRGLRPKGRGLRPRTAPQRVQGVQLHPNRELKLTK